MRYVFLSALLAMTLTTAGASEPNYSIEAHRNLSAREIQEEGIRDSKRIVMWGGDENAASKDSIRALVDKFYVDQFRHFQDPEAPYFLLMSRDAKLAMGIGGAVRMRGWFDFGGAVPYNGFIPSTIPVPANPEKRRRLNATPAGTALFFRIIGTNKALGNFQAFIQGGFDGYEGTGFKIKKSYATINDWTIGYAPTTFADLKANPPVIDASGSNGQVNNTTVQLQWAHTFKKGWSMAASFEFPNSKIADDGKVTKQVDDWFPDLVAYGQWEWLDGAGHVRLSGLARLIPHRNLITGKTTNHFAGGLQLSAIVPVGFRTTLYGEAVGGCGIESFINDFRVMSLDLIATPGREGEMYAPWCYGLTAAVRCDIHPKVFATIALGQARLMARNGVDPQQYKYGLYGAANLFWNMSARLSTGMEFLIGSRHNFNHESESAKRVNLYFQFSF